MRKSTKIWLITAASLVSLGLITFTAAMTVNHWDFSRLNTVKYESVAYEITEDFENISILTQTSDIHFAISEDGNCKVSCNQMENEKHSVSVTDDTLTIQPVHDTFWIEYIGISLGTPSITIYLPKSEFENIQVNTTTGNIDLENITATNIEFSVTTGDVKITNCQCDTLISEGSLGNLTLTDVIAAESFSLTRSTGDIRFNRCDAGKIFAKTDLGNVEGSLLSDKVFLTRTDLGTVDVPSTTTGGKCELYTDTGNIKIKIQ